MLQKLNERIQGVIAWIVIILIAVTFTMFGVDYYMQSHHTSSEAEATVNDQPLSKKTFDINYRRARQQRDASQMSAAGDKALQNKVLEEMIVNEITVQAARKAGFEVNLALANAAIMNIPQFQQDGHFSTERYRQALNSAMLTPDTLQSEVRQGMLLNQQRFAFIGSAFALPNEIRNFVKLYMQKRDYDYVVIPGALFADKKLVTEDQINSYYKLHQNEFLEPEKVSLDFIRLSMQQIKKNVKIQDEQVTRYYEDNQSSFLTPARWKVAHILFAVPTDATEKTQERIRKDAQEIFQTLQKHPQQFEQYVKSHSADKLSLSVDGMLPWITAGRTEFDKALSTLNKPGQIASPIRIPSGYEIFKLVDYKPAKLKSITEVKQQISEQLTNEVSQNEYAKLLEQVTDLSYQAPDSLSGITDELKLPVEQTETFTRAGGKSELTKNSRIINAAFSHDVLETGNNSEPIQLDNDSMIVLRVKKHIPASKQTLPQVKEAIINKLALQQGELKAKASGFSLLSTEAQQDAEFLKSHQLSWHEVKNAARDADSADPMINELAFSMPRAESRDGRQLMNGDFVVVRLKKINNGKFDALDKEHQASLAQQIEASYGLMDYDLYVNNLIKTAKVVRP